MYRKLRLSEKEENEIKTLSKQLMSQMMVSDNSSWLKVKKIILRILDIIPVISSQLAYDITDQLKRVNSLLTLLFIYNQDINQFRRTNSFRQQFITMRSKENFYKNMNKWLAQQPQQICDEAVELIVQNLSTFFVKEMAVVKYEDLHFLLTIFNRFKLKSDKEIKTMMNFISQLKKIQMSSMGNLGIKQLALIKIICEVLGNEQGAGNLGILFDQSLIGYNQSKNIDRFCNIQSEYLLQLPAETLQRIFKSLCKVGINYLITEFIYRTSRILANEQQFYKLASLYQKIILPQIALRAKTCTKSKVDESVLTLTEFYVYGFFVYYKLQKSAIQCLLANVEHIKNEKIKGRWIWLCLKAAQKHEQKIIETFLKEQFSKKGLDKIEFSERQREKVLLQYQSWQISPRNIRNLKKYNYEDSLDLKGIINHSCQCYIISIVQAFFMTVSLGRIIDKAQPRYTGFRAIDNLKNLFEGLSNDSKKLPSVDRLKKDGPEYFSQSQRQQDAQNYLIILLQQLEEQFKKQKLLQEFKKIFQIETKDTIVCKSCKNQKEITQHQYARTFAHGEQFVLERSQDIIDYKCDRCGKKECKKNTAISLKSDIAILHINRFSSKGGASKKELPTQKIKRKINNYDLVGMVFHIGKNMQSGHYTYFTRINKKRWAEMNDTQVFQFDLTSQDEEFQKQFKAWKTPYILFYKKERQSL